MPTIEKCTVNQAQVSHVSHSPYTILPINNVGRYMADQPADTHNRVQGSVPLHVHDQTCMHAHMSYTYEIHSKRAKCASLLGTPHQLAQRKGVTDISLKIQLYSYVCFVNKCYTTLARNVISGKYCGIDSLGRSILTVCLAPYECALFSV